MVDEVRLSSKAAVDVAKFHERRDREPAESLLALDC